MHTCAGIPRHARARVACVEEDQPPRALVRPAGRAVHVCPELQHDDVRVSVSESMLMFRQCQGLLGHALRPPVIANMRSIMLV